jgi:hypothetical protein
VRSPPLPGVDHPSWDGLAGETPGIMWRAVFSEGRGLRARVGRPHASPGYRMITEERTSGRWPKREMLRSSASLSRGRAEPAPPRGGPSKLGWPCGGNPGDNVEGGFLGGARSPRPGGKTLLMPRHFITRGEWPGGRGLMETCLGQAQAFFNGRAEPASRHKARRVKGNLVGRAPGQAKVAVFRKSSWDPLTSAFGASPKVGMLLEGK